MTLLKQEVIEAIREVFGDGDDAGIALKRVPLICEHIKNTDKTLEDIKEMLDKKFVTKESFWPVKTLVYGAVGIMLTSLLTAVIYLVIKK